MRHTRTLLVSAALMAAAAMPAAAAITFSFDPGAPSPSAGYTVIETFDDLSGLTSYANAQVKTPPADSSGAPPANSVPFGTSYLSVLGGGFATFDFAGAGVHGFQFDWGSIDTYNTLTIYSTGGNQVVVPGGNFPNLANGNQVLAGTNGLFTVKATAGELFTGFRMDSTTNSFEIDNVAVVPEPATWALMVMGFGGAGAMLRKRRGRAVFA